MQDTHPPVIAVWDASSNCYVQASASVCVSAGDFPGSLCGAEVFRRLGGTPLCAEHYDRALYDRRVIFRQEDEDYGWSFEARRWDPDAMEVVYYLRRSDGLIKIGTTARFGARLSSLQGQHGPLQILLTHRGDRISEHGMHLKFADLRVGPSEWFRPGKDLLDWIVEVRRRQEKVVPTGLLPGTVALSEVIEVAGPARQPPSGQVR
jgi:hypothetical protein